MSIQPSSNSRLQQAMNDKEGVGSLINAFTGGQLMTTGSLNRQWRKPETLNLNGNEKAIQYFENPTAITLSEIEQVYKSLIDQVSEAELQLIRREIPGSISFTHIVALDAQIQKHHDFALKKIWGQIAPSNKQRFSAAKIRRWMSNQRNQERLKKIKELELMNMKLQVIPKEIALFSCLEFLDLSFNDIRKIPKSLVELIHLEWLFLDYNKIRQIPKNLINLSKLTWAKVDPRALQTAPKEVQSFIAKISKLHD